MKIHFCLLMLNFSNNICTKFNVYLILQLIITLLLFPWHYFMMGWQNDVATRKWVLILDCVWKFQVKFSWRCFSYFSWMLISLICNKLQSPFSLSLLSNILLVHLQEISLWCERHAFFSKLNNTYYYWR